MTENRKSKLAINGGSKLRDKPMPYRQLFGPAEFKMVRAVFETSWENQVDFGIQGKYEKMYTSAFCEFQGGGFADAVNSGVAAVYLSLKSLDLDVGSDVIISPVTDPGSVMPVILQGHNPILVDSEPGSFNISTRLFEKAITPNTQAAILTHSGGNPFDLAPIVKIAKERGIKIVEDCSQAHGAMYKEKRVGKFGVVAALSTMYSKNHATGGCGGLVYTLNEELYWRIRSLADRGKPFNNLDFDPKNPSEFLFPSLNYNQDEISCAIGYSTLSRLPEIIEKRIAIADEIDSGLDKSLVVFPCRRLPHTRPSPFFHTVHVDTNKLKVSKIRFGEAIAAEGIGINYNYKYVVSEWKWLQQYLPPGTETPNAVNFRDNTVNILYNEQYTSNEVEDILAAIEKVESELAI